MKKLTLALLVSSLCLLSCSGKIFTPEKVIGTKFPDVKGQSLAGESVMIPAKFLGKQTVLLVGYKQNAQFDIDRWILGILQADIPIQIVEVPTIAGLMPQVVQGFIDNGMRSGIPKEDWASVVTVYEDAPKIIEALGNERQQNAQVVLLNKSGEIVWTTNRGYSAAQVLEVKKVVESLAQ